MIRKGDKPHCEDCEFMNECALYGAGFEGVGTCDVIDINGPYVIVITPNFDPDDRIAQTFFRERSED